MATQNLNNLSTKASSMILPAPWQPSDSIPEVRAKIPRTHSSDNLKKSKVRRMASMLNSKISKLIRRNSDKKQYDALVNELSPKAKSATRSRLAKFLTLPRTRRYNKEIPEESFENPQEDDDGAKDATNVPTIGDESHGLPHLSIVKSKEYEDLRQPIIIPTMRERRSNSLDLAKSKNLQAKWLQEIQYSSPTESKEVRKNSATDKLLEETIAKLEADIIQNSQKNEEANAAKVKSSSTKSRKKKRAPAVPTQKDNTLASSANSEGLESGTDSEVLASNKTYSIKPGVSSESSTTSSRKNSEAEESETDTKMATQNLVSSTKASENSTPKSSEAEQSETDNVSAEAIPVIRSQLCTASSSKDSDIEGMFPQDSKVCSLQTPNNKTFNEDTKPAKSSRKKKMRRSLSWRKDNSLVETKTISSTDSESENKNAKRQQDTANQSLTGPSVLNRSSLVNSSLNTKRESQRLSDTSIIAKSLSPRQLSSRNLSLPQTLGDSFDLGFETGSNGFDSPNRIKSSSPLSNSDASCFSTPIKRQGQKNLSSAFNESGDLHRQAFSPIPTIRPPKSLRRRTIYDSESRRSSSIAMQVIREDRSWEHDEKQLTRSMSNTNMFFANAPTMDNTNAEPSMVESKSQRRSSCFWIKSGDFYVALEIFPNDNERVRLLYEIFSQRSCDSKEVYFGIDGHKFCTHKSKDNLNISQRFTQSQATSHYWFSTGDMTIPFSGKMLSAEKIQRLFQFVKATVEETGLLQFGVDDVEFSKVCELWQQSPKCTFDNSYSMPKYSMESSYSMPMGRQSPKYSLDSSYSMPGRLQRSNFKASAGLRKYLTASRHSSVTDHLDFESDGFDSPRSSMSPFGSGDTFDFNSVGSQEFMMVPKSSTPTMDNFGQGYENEPLDQLFKDKPCQLSKDKSKIPVADLMAILQVQHQRLSSVQGRLSNYHNSPIVSYDALEAIQDTPEYLPLLKNIVTDIQRIGSSNGFKFCSLEELERYMFFLSRYADIRLNSCSKHMNNVMKALRDRREIYV